MQHCLSLENHFHSLGGYKILQLQSNKMSQKATVSNTKTMLAVY